MRQAKVLAIDPPECNDLDGQAGMAGIAGSNGYWLAVVSIVVYG